MNPKPPSDANGISPVASAVSDHEWLHTLFERYERPLVAYVARLLGDDWDNARDCVQDVFLRLCREPRENVEGYVEAWLFKCCRNRAMDRNRKESLMVVQYASEHVSKAPGNASHPSESLVSLEEKGKLQHEIGLLSQREQEVLVLRLQQGLSYKQIAEVMELSVSHVGVLIHQAVTNLRKAIPAS